MPPRESAETKEAIHLAEIARKHKIDPASVIDPVALAVQLVETGMPVAQSAKLCGVGRTALHRKINQIRLLKNNT